MLGGYVHQTCSQIDLSSTHVTDSNHTNSPAWKRLISHTLTTEERISLITEIFSHRDQVVMVGRLYGDDAQTFIDAVDEVRLYNPSTSKERVG